MAVGWCFYLLCQISYKYLNTSIAITFSLKSDFFSANENIMHHHSQSSCVMSWRAQDSSSSPDISCPYNRSLRFKV